MCSVHTMGSWCWLLMLNSHINISHFHRESNTFQFESANSPVYNCIKFTSNTNDCQNISVWTERKNSHEYMNIHHIQYEWFCFFFLKRNQKSIKMLLTEPFPFLLREKNAGQFEHSQWKNQNQLTRWWIFFGIVIYKAISKYFAYSQVRMFFENCCTALLCERKSPANLKMFLWSIRVLGKCILYRTYIKHLFWMKWSNYEFLKLIWKSIKKWINSEHQWAGEHA